MGQFSWITQDTDEAIREFYGCKAKQLTTAYLHDNKGNSWQETSYEGYGEFGGKDFYQLLLEMNEPKSVTGDKQKDRCKGIDLAFKNSPSGENPDIIYPNLTRLPKWTWVNARPKIDPNQGWGDN